MNPDKEEEMFCKRLKELSQQSYTRGICVYSSFLNINELNLFYKISNEISGVANQLWGGYEEAERRVICFYEDDSFTNVTYPIVCLSLSPVSTKYSDTLNHRDYLGAILNLGIERSKIGDIIISDKDAFVFCHEAIADFICENLNKVKHTNILVSVVDFALANAKPKTEEISGTVTSVRLDALLSLAFSASRSSLTGLIAGGKVFVNGKTITSNSFAPKENDTISVRGYGKFIFRRIQTQTKKNRYRIVIDKYC